MRSLYTKNQFTFRFNLSISSRSGHAIVFGTETGVSLTGDIILRSDDVHDQWLQVLQSLHSQVSLLQKIPAAEQRLSRLLNNIQVSQPTYLFDINLNGHFNPSDTGHECMRTIFITNFAVYLIYSGPGVL